MLVVGAGGIGCELIKNLVLSGIVNIDIIDLDTIDISNLNRQFLFRKKHVGMSKALVAREIAIQFNPSANVQAYHGNIKTKKFDMDYFKQFTVVLNALDNVDARRHVNRLCLATKVPLIESGTTGYLGQVSVIMKDESECYECTPKVTQKVYPICTIRSTPEKPVHCVVWAKECYKLLFGKMKDSMLWEKNEEGATAESAFMHLVKRPSVFDKDSLEKYAIGVFDGLFQFEIAKKIEMNLYKGASKTPLPILFKNVLTLEDKQNHDKNVLQSQQIWSLSDAADMFVKCIVQMYMDESLRKTIGDCAFDKDDTIAMEFVTAACNLRAHIFHIPLQSYHDCKGIAGNIIPAIATTNAIIAGLQVCEAFKIIDNPQNIAKQCKYTYCNRVWDSRGMLLNPVALAPPSAKCYVCSTKMLDLIVDTTDMTLRTFVTKILKARLGVHEPSISIGANTIYEEGEEAEECLLVNLDKKLCNLPAGGVEHGTILSVEDFCQDFTCQLCIQHQPLDDFDPKQTPQQFLLGDDIAALESVRKSTLKRKLSTSMDTPATKKACLAP